MNALRKSTWARSPSDAGRGARRGDGAAPGSRSLGPAGKRRGPPIVPTHRAPDVTVANYRYGSPVGARRLEGSQFKHWAAGVETFRQSRGAPGLGQ